MRIACGLGFDIPDGYLDTAGVGVPPKPVAEAVAAAVHAWQHGRSVPADFDAAVAVARSAFAELVGVPAGWVASGATVSGMLGTVAASLPSGTRVLVADGEFTSVTFPFAAQAGRGVVVDEVPQADLAIRAPDYDVVAVSVVQSADGAIADLAALRAARAAGTRVVLDATQALGWFAADLSWADVVVVAGYKWLLSPRGVAWMAVRPDWALTPYQAGWFAGEVPRDSVYGLPLRLAADARALDVSPVWFAQVGAAAALPWLAGLDRAAVQAHCGSLADALRAELGLPATGSAIVSVRGNGVLERLAAAGVRAGARAGGARLAFHLYNTADDLDRAVDALQGAG